MFPLMSTCGAKSGMLLALTGTTDPNRPTRRGPDPKSLDQQAGNFRQCLWNCNQPSATTLHVPNISNVAMPAVTLL